jgi:GAF domain-containing protein
MSSDISPAQPVVSAEQALEFVARASALLARSLDYETTLRQVAPLAVPDVADWCGVLLIEPDGEERELSSGYEDPELDAVLREIRERRRATADASESRRVAQSGQPILAPDVRTAIGADVDERQRKLVDRLAPKSYLIVPLPARGRILGSMTLLSTRDGRHYAASDLAFAEALAERCALAIDNARLHDSAERSLSVLHTVFSSAPVGLALVDRDLRVVRVNDTFAAFDSDAVQDELLAAFRRVLDTGEAVLDRDISTASPGKAPRHWNASFTPVTHADGSVTGVIVAVVDVTERRALLDAERTPGRARTSWPAPGRSSTRRWTTRRPCGRSRRSRSPRSPTGAR